MFFNPSLIQHILHYFQERLLYSQDFHGSHSANQEEQEEPHLNA